MGVTEEQLIMKIKILNESIWERRAGQLAVDDWLGNFKSDHRLNCLFLLSNFLYFGNREMRELMTSLYRDLYKIPIIHSIRKDNQNTRDPTFIGLEFEKELRSTKFIGIGNPSESGCHLLYYLRQENGLPKEVFSHTHELFDRSFDAGGGGTSVLRYPKLKRYIFIDDFCGTGNQTSQYLSAVVDEIQKCNPDAILAYYVLFATNDGLQKIRDNTCFGIVESVIELDHTFRVFGDDSRYFNINSGFDKSDLMAMCVKYGKMLCSDPLGYGDCQLLVGFHHNIPDNTLPIIWFNDHCGGQKGWKPIFKRYHKKYNW